MIWLLEQIRCSNFVNNWKNKDVTEQKNQRTRNSEPNIARTERNSENQLYLGPTRSGITRNQSADKTAKDTANRLQQKRPASLETAKTEIRPEWKSDGQKLHGEKKKQAELENGKARPEHKRGD